MGIESKLRDDRLDIYRGFFMIYILSVVHLIYWLRIEFIAPYIKGLFLIEMPIVFYVSGWAFSISSKKIYLKYLANRLKRILTPYYIFVLLISLLLIVLSFFTSIEYVNQVYTKKYWIDSFLLSSPSSSAIWFVKIYLIISLLAPLIYQLRNHLKFCFFFTLFALFIARYYGLPNYLYYIFCYGFFFLAGICHKKILSAISIKTKFFYSSISLLIILFLLFFCDYDIDMQSNKFPPSLLFFSYNVFFLLIFGGQISKACVSLCHNKFIYKIVHIYAKEGYLIYLYQIILFYPLRLIFMKLHEANVKYHIPIEILLLLLSFIYIILSGALLGYVIGAIRKKYIPLL